MATKVTRYQTEDGRLHESMGRALAHEQKQKAIDVLRDAHYRGCCEDVESLMDFLQKHKKDIFHAMQWSLFPCLGDGE